MSKATIATFFAVTGCINDMVFTTEIILYRYQGFSFTRSIYISLTSAEGQNLECLNELHILFLQVL
jgi:hypothetical protein